MAAARDRPARFPRVQEATLAWLSADQMREVDRLMIEELGISLVQMMENAGRSLAELALRRFRPASVVVLAGIGGNGGGGLVAARHLANRGAQVTVVLADPERLGDVPRRQMAIVRALGIEIASEPAPAELVLDALIGYGLRGSPVGRTAELIRWANGSGGRICALDVPSGMDATSGALHDPSVRATATLTLAMPKRGLRVARDAVGELYLGDISVPPALYARLGENVVPPFGAGPIVRIVSDLDADRS